MRKKINIVIITADEERHRFFKKKLNSFKEFNVKLCISENNKKRQSYQSIKSNRNSLLSKHFIERKKIEKKFFNKFINKNKKIKKEIKIERGELNFNNKLLKKVIKLNPDFLVSYGCSIIKGEFLQKFKKKIINIHLGLSPYYRGSATNFWPFVKNQLQFLGITFMMIDEGIDTGKILHQFRPNLKLNDNVHTVGNKMIIQMIEELNKILKNFKKIKPKKQMLKKSIFLFKRKDFNTKAIFQLQKNMSTNMIKNYLINKNKIDKKFRIVSHDII